MGFDGFVMSDFIYGVNDTVEAANGGQDMEMCITQYFGSKLVKAVQDGFVPETKIDEAALRIVRTILAFDRGHKEYDMSVVGCKEHIALAKRAAEESITLIKNNGVLPFDKKKVKKLAVLGKLANYENIGDHGSSCVYPEYVVTPLQGIAAVAPDTEVIFEDGSDLEAAKKAAAQAEQFCLWSVIILMMKESTFPAMTLEVCLGRQKVLVEIGNRDLVFIRMR